MNKLSNLGNPVIVVPARLGSLRFPRKLLADVCGKPLVLWTAERIAGEAPDFDLFFAVDGEELEQVLSEAGFSTISTDPDLPSGTDRIAVANEAITAEKIINVQADEPFVTRKQILSLAEALGKEGADMSTLACRFDRQEDFHDPNQVKVVTDENGLALYFSRSPIPFPREGWENFRNADSLPLRHLGLYAYSADFLRSFRGLPRGRMERLEKLEQLRALEHGKRIAVAFSEDISIGVDSVEDLERIAPMLQSLVENRHEK